MQSSFAKQLDLQVWEIDVRVQKTDGSYLETFNMAIAIFQVKNMIERSWYIKNTFLLADISISVALDISFFILSNVEITFASWVLS